MDIGQVITTLRKKKSLSQSELAEKVDITQSSLSQIESGKKKPHRSTVSRICVVLEIPEQFFYFLCTDTSDLPDSGKPLFDKLGPVLKSAILQAFAS